MKYVELQERYQEANGRLKEVVAENKILKENNNKLNKQNKRITKRSNDLGIAFLHAKNYIRELNGDFKQYNKRERSKYRGGL